MSSDSQITLPNASFAVALAHQQHKVCRYERIAPSQPALAKRLMTARIVVAALEVVAEYHAEGLVMARVHGGGK